MRSHRNAPGKRRRWTLQQPEDQRPARHEASFLLKPIVSTVVCVCYEPLSPAVLPRCARPPRCGWWEGRAPAPHPTRHPSHATWVLVVESWLTQQLRTRPCRRPTLTLHLPCAFWHRRKGALKVALDCFLLPGSRDSGRCCAPVYSAVALRRPTRVDAVAAVRLAPHRHRALFSPAYLRQQQLLSSHVDSSPRQQQHVDSSPRQQHVDSSPGQQQLIGSSPGPA